MRCAHRGREVGVYVVALALALGACTPGVVWYGRSPDHAREAELMHLRADQWLRLDGHDGPVFEGIGADSVTFSPDGARVAYAASKRGRWRVVVHGVTGGAAGGEATAGPTFDGVGELVWSRDGARLVYAAERDARWHVVVVDARAPAASMHTPGPGFGAIYEGTLRVGGRGELAYVVEDVVDGARCVAVVHGAERGPCFDAVADLALDGTLAYVGARGTKTEVVVDGARASYHAVRSLTLGPGGRPVVVVARRAEADPVDVIVIDDVQRGEADAIRAVVAAPPGASRRVAWVASRAGREQLVVADGERVVEGPARDVVDAPVFGPDGVLGTIDVFDGRSHVIIDGVEKASHADAGELALGLGGRVAYVADDGAGPSVVVDGDVTPLPALLPGTLVFSRNGARWACLAGDPASREVSLFIDGAVMRPLDMRALAAHAQVHQRAGRAPQLDAFLRRWVEAEVERDGAPRPEEKP